MIYDDRIKHLIGILDPFGIFILVMRFTDAIMESAELIEAPGFELRTTCNRTDCVLYHAQRLYGFNQSTSNGDCRSNSQIIGCELAGVRSFFLYSQNAIVPVNNVEITPIISRIFHVNRVRVKRSSSANINLLYVEKFFSQESSDVNSVISLYG